MDFIKYMYARWPAYHTATLAGHLALAALLLLSVSLTAQSGNVAALYGGGSADGYGNRTAATSLSGQSVVVLYRGGSGDGYDQSLGNSTLDGQPIAVLYGGGSGDGFDQLTVAQLLSGGSLTQLYGGGNGDGYDDFRTTRILSGETITAIFGGGSGDGFDQLTVAQLLSGGNLTSLYAGGSGDGFDAVRTSNTLAGEDLAALYGGGAGDGFDVFRLDGGLIGLPLTLIVFEAIPQEKFVLLRWVTEDEIDTDFFTIEKTADGTSFVDVSEVEAAGFSELGERLYYETKDQDPYTGTSYYRLVTTDFDGTLSYSHLVQVQYSSARGWDFTAFPNPNTGNRLNILAAGAEDGTEMTLRIFDAAGRQVLERSYRHRDGTAESFDLRRQLAGGTYLLRLERGDGTYQAKLLMVKVGRP